MTNKEAYKGVIPALLTPLREDQTLDEKLLIRQINYLLDSGVHGLAPLGSTGEGANVSDEVWRWTTGITIREVSGRIPVYCGIIDSSTSGALRKAKLVQDMGGQHVLATPHFYMNTSCQNEVLRHFELLLTKSDVNVVLYNIPFLTHAPMTLDTIKRLASHPKVIAYKDTTQNWGQHQQILYQLDEDDISVWVGGEELVASSLLLGSHGVVAGYATLFPKLFLDCYNAAQKGDIEGAKSAQKEIARLKNISNVCRAWVSGMKYAASKMGLCTEYPVWPVEPLSKEEKYKIDKLLENQAYA